MLDDCYGKLKRAKQWFDYSIRVCSGRVNIVSGTHEHPIVKFEVTPIWNTMAVIPGHIKDEVIILGNHRDGGCNLS